MVGIITPINESIWEHLKLLYLPAVIFAIVEFYLLKCDQKYFFNMKACAILKGMVYIVVAYYTITGIIGKNIDIINIGIFYVASYLVSRYSYKKLDSKSMICKNIGNMGIYLLAIIFIMFFIFTFYQPNLGIFREP